MTHEQMIAIQSLREIALGSCRSNSECPQCQNVVAIETLSALAEIIVLSALTAKLTEALEENKRLKALVGAQDERH